MCYCMCSKCAVRHIHISAASSVEVPCPRLHHHSTPRGPGMDLMRFWSDLSMVSKFGLAAVAAILVVTVFLTVT